MARFPVTLLSTLRPSYPIIILQLYVVTAAATLASRRGPRDRCQAHAEL